LLKEFPKSLLAAVVSGIIYFLVCLILYIPAKQEDLLNEGLKTQNVDIVKQA
jgi:flagellar biosynthesis/type III secretory pathway M-ring protein FliF/YscJ